MTDNYIPAYPSFSSEGYTIQEGMTLRDWFAGMALQGLVMNAYTIDDGIAKTAYEQADAMMKARGE